MYNLQIFNLNVQLKNIIICKSAIKNNGDWL